MPNDSVNLGKMGVFFLFLYRIWKIVSLPGILFCLHGGGWKKATETTVHTSGFPGVYLLLAEVALASPDFILLLQGATCP